MQWGILVTDPASGDTLYSRNAGKLFIPASNQKLITGSVALHLLGPDFRFSTLFAAGGSVDQGVLHGDLVVLGQGDPSVSDHMRGDAMQVMRAVADSLHARGITRITGGLRSGADVFPDATLGFGWAWDDLEYPYAAGVDELYLNEGFSTVAVRAGQQAGDTVSVRTSPAATYPRVRVLARTAGGPSAPRGDRGLRLARDSTMPETLTLKGEIAAGDSAVLTIAYLDHAAAYLTALREGLVSRGISVDGGVLARPLSEAGAGTSPGAGAPTSVSPPEPAYTPLFGLSSPPLREIMSAFEKPSQNQIGEILFKTLGRARTGVGTADSARRVVASQLIAWGAAPDGFVVRDGSGLSRNNVVTPETLTHVLAAMRADTAFAVFHDALPVAGVDGTIRSRMRGSAAAGNLHAKTGTLDMVRSLSGYITTADGRQLIVVMLANNWTVPVREVEAVQDAIAIRLAQLRLGAR